ncbi:MAG: sugar phosphate nucleotidyltransferase [Cyanobacteriota bacterium]|nr:sugar phosphate nucleotidyltransferase [Cyanobacteriota bacterium]
MTQARQKVRKAVIPAAGFGTRMFPASKAVKKELFPIIDRDGRAKPIILAIVEEAIRGGIEEVGIVVQKSDRAIFSDFFNSTPSYYEKLSPANQEYCQYLKNLGNKITFIIQEVQEGYGHGVYCAKEWANDEPFLLLLGDHLYSSEIETNCVGQMLQIYEQKNQSVIGLRVVSGSEIHHYGCVSGNLESEGIVAASKIHEKPDINYARQHLHTEGMAEDEFLSIFGTYVLEPIIFAYLEENINNNFREKGEFQLTTCLERLREENGVTGYVVKGKCFDTGLPDVYRQTITDFK